MEKGDSAKLREVFHPAARMTTVVLLPDGSGQLRTETEVAAFRNTIAGLGPNVLREPIYRIRLRVYKGYAEVVARYVFFLRGAFRHCGIDSFQLMMTPKGWRVVQLTDTRQSVGCRIPARYRR